MSKMPIEWHQKCLNNMKIALKEKERAYLNAGIEMVLLGDRVKSYQKQIQSAIDSGLDSFDKDRYRKKRGAK